MADKPKRNVVRDTACPKCGKLYFKHALRVHTPFCKGAHSDKATVGAGASPKVTTAGTEPRKAPAPAPTTIPAPAKSESWFA